MPRRPYLCLPLRALAVADVESGRADLLLDESKGGGRGGNSSARLSSSSTSLFTPILQPPSEDKVSVLFNKGLDSPLLKWGCRGA